MRRVRLPHSRQFTSPRDAQLPASYRDPRPCWVGPTIGDALSDVPIPVLRCDSPDDPAGVAGGEDASGDVVDDDRTAADDRARTDGHARHDAHHPANPHVVAHRDGQRVLELPAPEVLVERVTSGVEAALRGYEHVAPERDLRLVQDDAVGVDEDIVPQLDVRAVVAEERWVDDEVLPGLADEPAQQPFPVFKIVIRRAL